jgi:hypothetical protein
LHPTGCMAPWDAGVVILWIAHGSVVFILSGCQ